MDDERAVDGLAEELLGYRWQTDDSGGCISGDYVSKDVSKEHVQKAPEQGVKKPVFYLKQATDDLNAFPRLGYAIDHVRKNRGGLLVVIDESEGSLDSDCLETDFTASFFACMKYFSLEGTVTITAPGGKNHRNHPDRKVYLQPKDAQSSAFMLAYRAILEREIEG